MLVLASEIMEVVRASTDMWFLSDSIGTLPSHRDTRASLGTRHPRRWQLAAAILTLGLTAGITGTAGQKPQDSSRQGLFLVARRDLSDPLFEKSVVLMLPIKGTPLLVGLIINRPTRVPLHDLFADSPALQKRDATAYFGGPVGVEVGALSALFRSATPPKDATLVFGDVFVSFDHSTIAALVGNFQQASTLRVFLGRAQWAPEQLENEMAKGGWYSVGSGADPIFSKLPEDAWLMLLDQAERPLVEYDPPLAPLCNFRIEGCGSHRARTPVAFWPQQQPRRRPVK
jgi:putative transcriptional regulator